MQSISRDCFRPAAPDLSPAGMKSSGSSNSPASKKSEAITRGRRGVAAKAPQKKVANREQNTNGLGLSGMHRKSTAAHQPQQPARPELGRGKAFSSARPNPPSDLTSSPSEEVFHLSLDGSTSGSPKSRHTDLPVAQALAPMAMLNIQNIANSDLKKLATIFKTPLFVYFFGKIPYKFHPEQETSAAASAANSPILLRKSSHKILEAFGPELETKLAQDILGMLRAPGSGATPRDISVASVMLHQGRLTEADKFDTAALLEAVRIFIDAV